MYSTGSYSEKNKPYHAIGPGKYYHFLYNMKMNDRTHNAKFAIAGSVQMHRFQCYKTVVCKFPYGKEAPY